MVRALTRLRKNRASAGKRNNSGAYLGSGALREGHGYSPVHQISGARMLTESRAGSIKPRRIARKGFDGGLVFAGDAERRAVLAVRRSLCAQAQDSFSGIFPDVPPDRARARHEFARNLLAHGGFGRLAFAHDQTANWQQQDVRPYYPVRGIRKSRASGHNTDRPGYASQKWFKHEQDSSGVYGASPRPGCVKRMYGFLTTQARESRNRSC